MMTVRVNDKNSSASRQNYSNVGRQNIIFIDNSRAF